MQERSRARLRLAPGVPNLAALGVDRVALLLGPDGMPDARARRVWDGPGGSVLRYPLPGTPGEDGRRRGRPGGAGTGWLRLRRFHGGGWMRHLAARLTAPRSASLAERAWNLACCVRAAGVGTPELMAVGSAGQGLLARRSFLVTRELEGYEDLATWLAQPLSPAARAKGARALGAALGKLLGAGLVLPELGPAGLFLSIEADEPGWAGTACADHGSGGPRKNRLPSVVVGSFASGRLSRADLEGRARDLLARLWRGLDAERPPWRLGARTLVHAARAAGLSAAARRRLWRALTAA